MAEPQLLGREISPEEEARVISGILLITVGQGIVKAMPTLPAKYVDEWAKLLPAAGGLTKVPSDWTMADVSSLSGETVAHLLDLVVAYDEARDGNGVPHRTGALGGREWLEENADPRQLHAAAVQMVGNAFPLADDPAALLGLMLMRVAGPSGPPNSTSGSSMNGASRPKRSGRRSTRSR